MNKFLIIGFICLLLVGSVGILVYEQEKEVNKMEDKIYQGPIPLGYDLEHFRETGETIKEVKE